MAQQALPQEQQQPQLQLQQQQHQYQHQHQHYQHHHQQHQQQQQQLPSLILLPPRDPGTFSGTGKDKVNVEDWVALYERVSEYYRWDPTLMLANVVFYLRDTALTWYETHESELTSWDVCKLKLLELFSRPFGRQQAARKDLECRVQTSTESYVSYIQDVLGLCRKVDENMSETVKLAQI